MEAARPTTLYLLWKDSLGEVQRSHGARGLALRPCSSARITGCRPCFPTENQRIEDFTHLTARLRAAMEPRVVDILLTGSLVVFDFLANTVSWRGRSLINAAGATSFMSWMLPTRSARKDCDSAMSEPVTAIKSATRNSICSRAISSLPRRRRVSTSPLAAARHHHRGCPAAVRQRDSRRRRHCLTQRKDLSDPLPSPGSSPLRPALVSLPTGRLPWRHRISSFFACLCWNPPHAASIRRLVAGLPPVGGLSDTTWRSPFPPVEAWLDWPARGMSARAAAPN
jgi:hypothetical protein